MGNSLGHDGAIDRGRLSEREVNQLRHRLGLGGGEEEKIRNSKFQHGLPLDVFVNSFPPILRPYIAQLLPPLKKFAHKDEQEKHGRRRHHSNANRTATLSLQELVLIASFCAYGMAGEHLNLMVEGFLQHQENVEAALVELMTFAYLENVFVSHPSSFVYASSSDKDSRPYRQLKEEKVARNDSWDIFGAFKPTDMKKPLDFSPLVSSFREYVATRSAEDDHTKLAGWIEKTLPSLPGPCSTALKMQLLMGEEFEKVAKSPIDVFSMPAVWRRIEQEDEDSVGLPLHSDSMDKEQKASNGWRGLWLAAASRCLNDELCFALRQVGVDFKGNRWTRLYASWQHGRSGNAFVSRILGYPSLSVLVVRTKDAQVFGACASCTWEEGGPKYFGNSHSFLFAVKPHFRVYRAKGGGENFVFLNTKNSFAPKGIGFGGQPGTFRLWIDIQLQECYACKSDRTYEAGQLVSAPPRHGGASPRGADHDFQRNFEVDEVEVWGAGGAEAARAQNYYQNRDEQLRLERRQVDKARLADNDFNKEFLFGGHFKAAKEKEERGGAGS